MVRSNSEKAVLGSRKCVKVPSKKEIATLEQCIEVLDWYPANGRNQFKTALFARLNETQKMKVSLINRSFCRQIGAEDNQCYFLL